MDLQSILHNAVAAQRAERMKGSEQLMLGELTLKMEAVKNKALPVIFDEGKYVPSTLDSWRGSYDELAIEYTEDEPITGKSFIELLKEANGKTYTGYKGGDFTMGKATPIWVANYGSSSGFREGSTAVVDVEETEDAIVLKTKVLEY
jgi:hypothetical protein